MDSMLTTSGSGYGCCDGYGYGDVDGYGYGHGSGDGYGYGSGSGYGYGYGFGVGEHIGDFNGGPIELIRAFQVVRVGCQCHTVEYWKNHWREIAEDHDFDVSEEFVDEILEKCKLGLS